MPKNFFSDDYEYVGATRDAINTQKEAIAAERGVSADSVSMRDVEKGMRDEYTKLRDIVHKRVARAKQSGESLEGTNLSQYVANDPTKLSNIRNSTEFVKELNRLRRTVYDAPTGSLSGIKKVRSEQAQRFLSSLQSAGIIDEDGAEELSDQTLKNVGEAINLARSLNLQGMNYLSVEIVLQMGNEQLEGMKPGEIVGMVLSELFPESENAGLLANELTETGQYDPETLKNLQDELIKENKA